MDINNKSKPTPRIECLYVAHNSKYTIKLTSLSERTSNVITGIFKTGTKRFQKYHRNFSVKKITAQNYWGTIITIKLIGIIRTNRVCVMPVLSSCEESLNEMHLAGRDELCWQMNQAGWERARKGRSYTTLPSTAGQKRRNKNIDIFCVGGRGSGHVGSSKGSRKDGFTPESCCIQRFRNFTEN